MEERFATQTIEDFTGALSCSAPVPGGGGAAGLVAAIGSSLSNMVLSLTTGKKKYAAYQDEIERLIPAFSALTKDLLDAMDKDAEAFYPLSQAYGLPKDTPEEQAHREEVMAEALVTAATAPLTMMEKIMEAIRLTARVAEIGSRLAISDAGVAAQCLGAAMQSASLNVYINTKLMKDRETAIALEEKADALIRESDVLVKETYAAVVKAIRG
ncbi:MAG: cyclodeaminase/cyclohydrolase family protein [Lachnospiraceae bacterium]|nr:cyclodeaminase/cyclohydrolase family protein [Lachnospiraceae bacterium]